MLLVLQMDVKIKVIDKNVPMPRYATDGSVGFDLASREDVEVLPNEFALIPLNIVIKVPEGYALFITPRSSLFLKKRLIVPNSVGIIDQDYCGPEDEVKLLVYNIGDKPVKIKKGEYIAQGIIVKIEKVSFSFVESVECKSRGGFGSTGGYLFND